MKVIGLTGGVGCGKSTVAKMIKEKFPAEILIADDIGFELMMPGAVCYEEIVKKFGTEVLLPDKTLNRPMISKIVFGDKMKLECLNQIIHPRVKEYIKERLEHARQSGLYSYVFIESAIILEAGYEDICDEFWYVTASEEIRRARLKESRGYTDEKIDSIMKNPKHENEFQNRCSRVLDNNGEIEKIFSELKLILV